MRCLVRIIARGAAIETRMPNAERVPKCEFPKTENPIMIRKLIKRAGLIVVRLCAKVFAACATQAPERRPPARRALGSKSISRRAGGRRSHERQGRARCSARAV